MVASGVPSVAATATFGHGRAVAVTQSDGHRVTCGETPAARADAVAAEVVTLVYAPGEVMAKVADASVAEKGTPGIDAF